MQQIEPVRVGIVGVGDISRVYCNAISRSQLFMLGGISTRNPASVTELAGQLGTRSVDLPGLLADDDIELVVNLTPGSAHESINAAVVDAGKHLYSEKPFALSHRVASELADKAQARGVRIGSAPDTFYGNAHQAARRALDAGRLGEVVFGMSCIGLPGLEHFHPNPAAYYRPGGEPPYDVGPYYIAMWVNLLGPVRRVYAASGSGQASRTIRRGPLQGTSFPVEVDTTFIAVLEFDNAAVSLVLSLDSAIPLQQPGRLYGSDAILELADPLFFSGEPALLAPKGRIVLDAADLPFAEPNRLSHSGQPVADYRGVGVSDLALAIRTGRPHRTAPDFIVHCVAVAEAIAGSAYSHRAWELTSTCVRPAPVDAATDALLVTMTPSPFDLETFSAEPVAGRSLLVDDPA